MRRKDAVLLFTFEFLLPFGYNSLKPKSMCLYSAFYLPLQPQTSSLVFHEMEMRNLGDLVVDRRKVA
jgi:hypothetical protein